MAEGGTFSNVCAFVRSWTFGRHEMTCKREDKGEYFDTSVVPVIGSLKLK